MIEVDKYLGREFNLRTYNCWDFIRDVWKDHCGVDLGSRTPNPATAAAMVAAFQNCQFDVEGQVVKRIEEPEDPCLVMLIRPKVMSHVGVFVRGKLLHLAWGSNVRHQPLDEVLGFSEIRWYK